MPKTYRVAVIGHTGRGDYGHGLGVVWKDIANAEVVAVADPDEKGRADAVKKTGAKKGYADYKTMLEKEKPQIVSVATRHLDQHKDMVVACANAGASVFLEKPMARTLAEADEMVKACETKHVKLAIAFQTRYSPRLARVREMIKDEKLGDLLELRGRGKEDAKRGGGEDLMVLGTHIVDLMRFLAGDPAWCFAQVLQGGKPAVKAQVRHTGPEGMGPVLGDHINATYGLPKGALGTFGTLRARHGANNRFALSVYGTKGVVQLHTGSLPAVWYCDDPSWMPGKSKKAWQEVTSAGVGKPEKLKGGDATAGNVWIVKDLIEAIEKDRQPLGSMYDARAALEMVLAVYASHKANAPVAMPLKERKHPLAAW
jgi:predicted dehydrogenase